MVVFSVMKRLCLASHFSSSIAGLLAIYLRLTSQSLVEDELP
jgi:hypothetical protein